MSYADVLFSVYLIRPSQQTLKALKVRQKQPGIEGGFAFGTRLQRGLLDTPLPALVLFPHPAANLHNPRHLHEAASGPEASAGGGGGEGGGGGVALARFPPSCPATPGALL